MSKQPYFKQISLVQTIQFWVSKISMSKVRLFQTIQFSIQKLLHSKQFSLTLVCSLNVKIVLFPAIQFSKSAQFSSIWPIDGILSGATTPS